MIEPVCKLSLPMGSCFQVIRSQHKYSDNPEIREEGGTPEILGSIRAGLAVQLKESVGSEVIMASEEKLCRRAFREWEGLRELVVVGPDKSVSRLPIFSFLVCHPSVGCSSITTLSVLSSMISLGSRRGEGVPVLGPMVR